MCEGRPNTNPVTTPVEEAKTGLEELAEQAAQLGSKEAHPKVNFGASVVVTRVSLAKEKCTTQKEKKEATSTPRPKARHKQEEEREVLEPGARDGS